MNRSEVGGALLALVWTAVLLWLAFLWIRSPYLGTWLPFANWTLAALPAALLSGWALGSLDPGVRVPGWTAWLAALLWAAAAWIAASGIGPEWILDGEILRNPWQAWAGRALRLLPMAFALAVSVGALSLALEARYRARHGPR